MLSSLDLRFRAIMALQAIRARHSPGSERYEHAEHAIDLVLNEERTIDNYLIRNVLRDAERVHLRQRQSRQFLSVSDDIEILEHPALIEPDSPHDISVAKELFRHLSSCVVHLGAHGLRTLEGMLLSESLTETANAIGLTTSRVNQLRREIRACAETLSSMRPTFS